MQNSNTLVSLRQSEGLALVQEEVEAAKAFALEQHAPATRRAYLSDWEIFEAWCVQRRVSALPASPEAVATFLGSQASTGTKTSTLSRRVAAIRYVHSLSQFAPPTSSELVRATMRGIRRTLGVAPTQKAAATSDRLLNMVRDIPTTNKGLRDKALLLLGFAGAFRRSEAVALNVEDIEYVEQGLRVTVRRSKTDQDGAGYVLPVMRGERMCPVDAVTEWISASGIKEGAVFRRISRADRVLNDRLTAQSVALVVKNYALLAGFDPDIYAGHSLRSGFATSAVVKGASLFRVMDITRHKSTDTLRGYVRRAEEFKEHAGAGLM